ncbi:hypothetical protein PAMP_013933 [Pampus punctatissimus]
MFDKIENSPISIAVAINGLEVLSLQYPAGTESPTTAEKQSWAHPRSCWDFCLERAAFRDCLKW